MIEYGVFYSPAAISDLEAIYQYIACSLSNPIAGGAQEARIRKGIRGLGRFPLQCERVDWEPWRSMGVRRLLVDHFLAYYTVDEAVKEVTVLRIFYGGQNIEEIVNAQR